VFQSNQNCCAFWGGTLPLVKRIVSTQGIAPQKAVSFWENHMRSLGFAGTLSPKSRDHFFAHSTTYSFGKNELNYFHFAPFAYERTKWDCKTNSSDIYALSYLKSGSMSVQQGDRKALIKPGDCFLTYFGEPSAHRLLSSGKITTFFFKSSHLVRWLPSPFDITSTSLLKNSPFAKALSSLFDALIPSTLETLNVTPDAFTEQIFCLLAVIAGPNINVLSSYKESLLHRFRENLRAHCCDAAFNQSSFASELGVSARTVQKTFCLAGSSFGEELLLMRMVKARQYLGDPRYRRKNIAEIAAFGGYRHASHFISHFRKVHGLTPSSYRRIQMA